MTLFAAGLMVPGAIADSGAPIDCIGWTTDMVAESLSEDAFDGAGIGWNGDGAFYPSSLKPEGALCDAEGFLTTLAGNDYKIKLDGDNAFRLERYDDLKPLTFQQPVNATGFNLLVFANEDYNKNGTVTFTGKVTYEDGTSSDTQNFPVSYWNSTDAVDNVALSDLGLVVDYYGEMQYATSRNFRIYEIYLPSDVTKTATGVMFKVNDVSWGNYGFILGVNGSGVVMPPEKRLSAHLDADRLTVNQGETAQFIVNYTFGGELEADEQFSYSAVSDNPNFVIAEIMHDAEKHTLTVPVKANAAGAAKIHITLTLGDETLTLCGEFLAKVHVDADTADCVTISNWNCDVIAEQTPVGEFTSERIDNSNKVLYTDNLHAGGAIAGDQRIVVAKSGKVYKLAPYDANNAIVNIGMGSYGSASTISLETPIFTDEVSLLLISADGDSAVELTMLYEDDSKGAVQSFDITSCDKTGNTPHALSLGYADVYTDELVTGADYKVYEITATATRQSKLSSIKILNKGWSSKLVVLAVNAKDMHEAISEKYLNASIEQTEVRTYINTDAEYIVNYTLNEKEGSKPKLEYEVTADNRNVEIGPITNDAANGRLKVSVNSPYTGLFKISITLKYGAEHAEFPCILWVKSKMDEDKSNCVEIEGWTDDVIAEATPAADYASGSINGKSAALYTDDVYPQGFFAGDDRLVKGASGRIYAIAPYDSNNAAVLEGEKNETTLSLKTPIYTDQINILSLSALEPSDIDASVIYDDDSQAEPTSLTVLSWDDDDHYDDALTTGTVNISTEYVSEYAGRQLFELEIPTVRDHKVKAIKITNHSNGSVLSLLAVNAEDKKTNSIDRVREDAGELEYFTIDGLSVNNPTSGICIVKSQNGTHRKVKL